MTETPYGPKPPAEPDPSPAISERRGGGRSRPLTIAGVLLIVAGVCGLIGSAGVMLQYTLWPAATPLPDAMILICGPASALALVAVYVVFWRAGFPHRSRALTVVTLGIAVGYALGLLVGLIGVSRWAALLVAAVAWIFSLVFTITAARDRMLPRGFRVVPVVQFVLVAIVGGYYFLQSLVLGIGLDLTGSVFLGAGIAYVLLAAHSRAALEAAADARKGAGREQRAAPPAA